MPTPRKVALRPENEATRPPRSQRGKRVTTNYVNSISTSEFSAIDQQIQLLIGRYHLSAALAGAVANLIFGGSNG